MAELMGFKQGNRYVRYVRNIPIPLSGEGIYKRVATEKKGEGPVDVPIASIEGARILMVEGEEVRFSPISIWINPDRKEWEIVREGGTGAEPLLLRSRSPSPEIIVDWGDCPSGEVRKAKFWPNGEFSWLDYYSRKPADPQQIKIKLSLREGSIYLLFPFPWGVIKVVHDTSEGI